MRHTNEDFEVTIWSDVDVPKFLESGYQLQMLPESLQCFPMKHHWTATLMYVKLMAMWCKIVATDHESEMYYSDMFFAQLFNAEAVECGLCDTLFSPVRFERFFGAELQSVWICRTRLCKSPLPDCGIFGELS